MQPTGRNQALDDTDSVVTTVVTMRERCVGVLFFKMTLVWVEARCSNFYIPPPALIGMMIYPLDGLSCCS